MDILFIITGFILILIGIAVKHFKLYDLIAGYNTMPSSEKAKFDIESFAFLMRNAFVTMGLIIICGSIINLWLAIKAFSALIMVLTVLIGVTWLIILGRKMQN